MVRRGMDVVLLPITPPSPWARPPAAAPRALFAPHESQTQMTTAPQTQARSCSQDRTRPSPAQPSAAARSAPATQPSTQLPCTSPAAADARGRSCAEPSRNCKRTSAKRGARTHLIKIYFNAAHVRRADRDHAEKPVPPAPKQRNTFIQYKQIFNALRHPRRHRKQLACPPLTSAPKP